MNNLIFMLGYISSTYRFVSIRMMYILVDGQQKHHEQGVETYKLKHVMCIFMIHLNNLIKLFPHLFLKLYTKNFSKITIAYKY